MLSNWQTLSLIPTRTNTDSSCSVLCRASTSRNVSQIKEVHGRDNLGHAAVGRSRTTLFGIMACKTQSRLWVDAVEKVFLHCPGLLKRLFAGEHLPPHAPARRPKKTTLIPAHPRIKP